MLAWTGSAHTTPSRTGTSPILGDVAAGGVPPRQFKRGADRGIDGLVYFIDGPRRTTNKAVVQVKSGKVSSPHIRDLQRDGIERERRPLPVQLAEPGTRL